MVRKTLLLLACLAVAASGCSHIPYFRRWAKKPYYPYLKNKMFSFEHPRKWGDPIEIPGGVEFRAPERTAAFSMAFIERADPEYKDPDLYRRAMASWGAVEDEHRVETVEISSRTAYRVRHTTYRYDPEYLLGEKYQVSFTETMIVPDPRGLFIIRYYAPLEEFWRRRNLKHYQYFLRSLVMSAPKETDYPKPEP